MLLQKGFDSSVHNSFPFFSRTVLSGQVGRQLEIVAKIRRTLFFSTKTQHAILFLCHTQLIHVQFTRTFSQRCSQFPIFEWFFFQTEIGSIYHLFIQRKSLFYLGGFHFQKILVPNYILVCTANFYLKKFQESLEAIFGTQALGSDKHQIIF